MILNKGRYLSNKIFLLNRKDTTEYMPYKIRQVVEEISLGKHAPWEQQMKENEKGGRKADNAPPPQAVEVHHH